MRLSWGFWGGLGMILLLLSCQQKQGTALKTPDIQQNTTWADSLEQAQKEFVKSLRWVGEYKGNIPNKNSISVDMLLTLYSNNTYQLQAKYLYNNPANNKKVILKDEFVFTRDSSLIVLKGLDSLSNKLRLRNNSLVYLNPDGTPNTGSLAEFYILQKQRKH